MQLFGSIDYDLEKLTRRFLLKFLERFDLSSQLGVFAFCTVIDVPFDLFSEQKPEIVDLGFILDHRLLK